MTDETDESSPEEKLNERRMAMARRLVERLREEGVVEIRVDDNNALTFWSVKPLTGDLLDSAEILKSELIGIVAVNHMVQTYR